MTDERPEQLTVGFVGGVRPASNVRTFLANVRSLLQNEPTKFTCDLLVSSDTKDVEGFRSVDPGIEAADSATTKLRYLRRAIASYARERRPDVLFQVTRFPTHGIATAVAGRQVGTPTIARLAGDNFNEYKFAGGGVTKAQLYGLKNVLSLAAVHLPTLVIVLGPNGERQLRSRGRRSGIVEIPQPVDTGAFHPVGPERCRELRETLDVPDSPTRVLLTVGRLTRRKGLHDVAETARQLVEADADIRWIVLGDGPLRAELASIPIVDTRGRVPYDRVPEYYQSADLLVHSSLHEGLPNVLLEATACGLPSVARSVGECPMVASATFDDPAELPELVLADYDRPTLDERFDEAELAARYAGALTRAATSG